MGKDEKSWMGKARTFLDGIFYWTSSRVGKDLDKLFNAFLTGGGFTTGGGLFQMKVFLKKLLHRIICYAQ